MKVAVIGNGYVGTVVCNFLKDHYEVLVKDKTVEKHFVKVGGDILESTVEANEKDYTRVNECAGAIICVPTEMNEDGSCDVSIVEGVIKECQCSYILIKSTVPPGTTRLLSDRYVKRIAFSPEYIGESGYFTPFWKYPHPTDMKYHDFQIFGGERDVTNFFVEMFQRVLGPTCRYIQTDSTTAELTKYMENAWGATKVTFVNEFYRIAKLFGVDFRELRELWLLDGRIERAHTSVFEGNFGYGGKCFPKDVNAIVRASGIRGYDPLLLMEVIRSNARFREDNDA